MLEATRKNGSTSIIENGVIIRHFESDYKEDELQKSMGVERIGNYRFEIRWDWHEYETVGVAPYPNKNIRFKDHPSEVIAWNNKLQPRGRHQKLLLFSKTHVWEFEGKTIDGVCVVLGDHYTKNGKWSNTTYDIQLAGGIKYSAIRQSFSSGRYVDNVTSLIQIKKELGLEGLINKSLEIYLQDKYTNCWDRYQELFESIKKLEELSENDDFMEYEYNHNFISRKQGYNILLLDGKPWDFQESVVCKIINKDDDDVYQLFISTDVDIEELPERSPWDDESVEGRLSHKKDEPISADMLNKLKNKFGI